MKLKHLISTSAMIVAGFSSNQAGAVETSFLMCQSCPAGTYSAGGTSKSCTPCPKGQYQNLGGQTSCKACPVGTYSTAGATSCSPCASSTYSSWGGNCGPVTRTRTDYCQATGSTSSTANPKTVTENGNKGNTCGVGSYCPSGTNKNCTSCGTKANGYWTDNKCNFACNTGYVKSGSSCVVKTCTITIYTEWGGCGNSSYTKTLKYGETYSSSWSYAEPSCPGGCTSQKPSCSGTIVSGGSNSSCGAGSSSCSGYSYYKCQ